MNEPGRPEIIIDARNAEIDASFSAFEEMIDRLADDYGVAIDLDCRGARFGVKPQAYDVDACLGRSIIPWSYDRAESYSSSLISHSGPYRSAPSDSFQIGLDGISTNSVTDSPSPGSFQFRDGIEAMIILVLAFWVVGVLGSFATNRDLLSEVGSCIWNMIRL